MVRLRCDILCKCTDACAEDSVAFLQVGVCGCLLDDSGEVVAWDEGWVDVSFFGVDVLVGALCVEDICMLGAAMGYADEVFVGGWLWDGDLGWLEG